MGRKKVRRKGAKKQRKSSSNSNEYINSHDVDRTLNLKRQENIFETVHDYNVDPIGGHIYLFGEEVHATMDEDMGGQEPGVEYVMASRFIRNITLLQRDKSVETILVHMKTCGGLWEEGMAIHNAIKACPTPVTILNYTHARSMSSLIFQAANKRVMMPDSYFMYHTGDLALSGVSQQVYSEVDFQRKISDPRMLEIYSNEMHAQGVFKGQPKKDIKAYLKSQMEKKVDVFLSAREAVKMGLADEVFGANGTYSWKNLCKYTDEQLLR